MIAALLLGGSAWAQAPKPAESWTPLNFLIGEWEGVGSGAPGEAVGSTSFAFSLDKKILIRKNWAQYPPKTGEKNGLSHEDLMIFYPTVTGPSFRAIYFDNEGHVLQYSVSFGEKQDFTVLETDSTQPGPRYRLTYEGKVGGILENIFSIAPPGGEFKVYVRGSLKKSTPRRPLH